LINSQLAGDGGILWRPPAQLVLNMSDNPNKHIRRFAPSIWIFSTVIKS